MSQGAKVCTSVWAESRASAAVSGCLDIGLDEPLGVARGKVSRTLVAVVREHAALRSHCPHRPRDGAPGRHDPLLN